MSITDHIKLWSYKRREAYHRRRANKLRREAALIMGEVLEEEATARDYELQARQIESKEQVTPFLYACSACGTDYEA